MKSLKVKIKLNYFQKIKLETLSNEHRLLYNFLLSKAKEGRTFRELNELYKQFRKENNLTINSKSSQNTCRSLINNIKSFYALKKKDKTAQFPYKYKSWKCFQSFMLDWNNGNGGFKLIENFLTLNLNSKTNKLEIKLPEVCKIITDKNIKIITLVKEENNYFVVFVYSESNSNVKNLDKDNFLSIDLGYSNLITGFSNTIDNFSIKNLKQISLTKAIENVQSKKDKKKKRSNRYFKLNKILKRVKRKQVNKQKDFQHKLSRRIINLCKESDIGTLIVGDLKVKQVQIKNNKKINGLSKSTSSLGRFKTFLEYKSKDENIDFYKPSEHNTSKTNCLTDKIEFNSSDLSMREVKLNDTLVIDRDLNSAINIAKKVKGECLPQVLNQQCFELKQMYINNQSILMYEESYKNQVNL